MNYIHTPSSENETVMNIYVGHSSAFDYQNNLYAPIQNSNLTTHHHFIFPHLHSKESYESKSIILDCDVFIAEVSFPSTGLGIELGWANQIGCKVLCLHHDDKKPSSSLSIICSDFVVYRNTDHMIQLLKERLGN